MNDDQMDIFGDDDDARAHARHTDPDTSHEAARQTTPSLRQLQLQVLEYAVKRGSQGFIDPEMAEHFDCHGSTYRTRRSELVDMGLIADTGQRRSKHAVWSITDKGRGEAAMIGLHALDRAA